MAGIRIACVAAAHLVLVAAGVASSQEPETIPGGGGLELAVYEGGNSAGPPIVFIHGFTGNHLAWGEQLSGPLAEDFRLVAFDLRGHGASEKPLEPESYTDSALWAEDLAAVIRARELDRPVLVGWSYGGFVMADYLRAFGTDSIGGLVFVASTTQLGTEEGATFLGEELLAVIGGVLSPDVATRIESTRAFLRLLTARPLDDDVFETTLAGSMMVPAEVRAAMFDRAFDNEELLAGVDVPVLVIQGADDRIVRPSAAERFAGVIPGTEPLLYQGVGHMPFLEDSERFNRDLAEFVRQAHPE